MKFNQVYTWDTHVADATSILLNTLSSWSRSFPDRYSLWESMLAGPKFEHSFRPATALCCSAPAVTLSPSQRTIGGTMSDVVYVSKVRIERKVGPLRIAYLPGESQPVAFSVHGSIAERYKIDPATLTESHASTLDYVIAATAG